MQRKGALFSAKNLRKGPGFGGKHAQIVRKGRIKETLIGKGGSYSKKGAEKE